MNQNFKTKQAEIKSTPPNSIKSVKRFIGSAETTGKLQLSTFDFADYQKLGVPQHKPVLDIVFLEWFIGFFEAEGCLQCWKNAESSPQFAVEIIQKDAALMYKIRTRLGFGQVQKIIPTKPNHAIYYRLTTNKRENLERLILLLNGNLVTEKKREQFKIWITLSTAWLSGFIEGDGGFWVSQLLLRNKKKNKKKVIYFKIKFYLTQKEERVLLEQIKALFQISAKIRTFQMKGYLSIYNCLETSSFKSSLFILNYLDKYPFLGKRAIQLSRWKVLFGYRKNPRVVTLKLLKKFFRLIPQTNETNLV